MSRVLIATVTGMSALAAAGCADTPRATPTTDAR